MTKSDKCHNLLDSLSEYVDGTLADDLCEELNRHLEDCEDCQIVVDTLKKTIYLYHSAANEPVHVPEDVRKRLYQCLNLEEYMEKKS